ncbi:MAG: ATP synthase F1 subunit epsilon [Bdellovibrionales bacterium GWB1_52_6]|nr:MAG: ATP synthase F1 subunit epsilon [Bdellovibrionales bacterium GWB1_52_6]OFZ04406.1 MAG: ATP synthase F1 subunit epsilon [Bdellovibrionales bacterium GWA1_52_35]HCM40738.1 ATP synthase F1 subunit epsilon [Bdellovibrionales bacterium]
MSLKLTILSPERRLLENVSAESVTLFGSEGQIQIMPGHAPFIGVLETGTFSYRPAGGQDIVGAISHGFFEVKDDKVVVTAETLELKAEIDVNRAKKAQKLAEDALKAADLDEKKFKKYQLKLQRSLIRQHLGE